MEYAVISSVIMNTLGLISVILGVAAVVFAILLIVILLSGDE